MPFEDFQKLSSEEKARKFLSPEVVIPHSIPPAHMRITGVKIFQDR